MHELMVQVLCDGCRRSLYGAPNLAPSATEANARAERAGWLVQGFRRHVCPDCLHSPLRLAWQASADGTAGAL